jgi:SAM-dependent methyltransferase
MPSTSEIKSLPTLNRCGRTSTIPNEYSSLFIEYAQQSRFPVLDIGAAFGVATIPALLQGAAIIAVDIDAAQLEVLRLSVPDELQSSLTTIRARFPEELQFDPNTFGAVHASNLLNFLRGEEIVTGLKAIYRWLVPGGKLFAISGTPYARNVRGFIPVYQKRVHAGDLWPGEIEQLSDYSDDPTIAELPPFIHLLDDDVLGRAVLEAGFTIERLELYQRQHLPDYLALDGRENVGVVAFKPF